MWRFDDLPHVTDAGSLSRGHAYARQGRVVTLRRGGGVVRGEVQGSDLYRVRLGEGTWECDCPIGAEGAFCKHCVAVAIVAEQDGPDVGDAPRALGPDAEPHDPATAWLTSLGVDELLAIVQRASGQIPELTDFLTREYLAVTDDLTELKAEVDAVLRPRRPFYEYDQANRYARDVDELLDLLHDRGDRPSSELLAVVERAITLTVRTILRSDDSSGYQGDQIRGLLDLHERVAGGLTGTLDRAGRRRLAVWLHGFRFSGTQDFFEVDVDRYAEVLTADGVAHYRELVETSARSGGEDFAVEYARGRLAVLDRDADAIVRIFGRGLAHQGMVPGLVAALDEAGLHRLAVEHAERGLAMPRTYRATELVDRLVRDAVERGDLETALELRRDDFRAEPTSARLAAYATAAGAVGRWDRERPDAEAHLAEHSPRELVSVLLTQDRDDEAWAFAVENPTAAAGRWEQLCARRAVTAPEETVPHYEALISGTLKTTGRGNYMVATRLLLQLRQVSERAGQSGRFGEFMSATAEANRRRPTCIAEFRRAGLLT